MMNTRTIFLTIGVFIIATLSAPVNASAVSGQMFYTTYAGGTNFHKVDYSYDGASTFSLTNNTGLGHVNGADGITGNPQDTNSLFIGGQGNRIHRVSKTGALLQTLITPNPIFHLEVADSSTLYGSSIPSSGAFTRATINPDGSLSAPASIAITGGGSQLTQLITTPTGDYYTASGAGGFGNFGMVSVVGTTASLSLLSSGVPAAHGGVYDPFTNSIILMGDGHLTQLDLAGSILSDIAFSGQSFDQGTVDGNGHLFAASNTGHLTFIDYSASGVIGTGFRNTQFLASYLDDIAPLVGSGSTGGVPEPSTLFLLAVGLLGIGFLTRRPQR